MTLVKTVEMRVLADAGDAQAKLDELDAKRKELDGNAIRMRFRLDDAEGKAQLDAIRAKADKMGFKDIRLKVKVDGAGRALAELEAVRHEEDKLRDGGLMNRLGGLFSSGIGSLGNIPLVGGLASSGSGLGLGAVVGGLAALLNEVVAVGSGFAAAGAGAGAFALLAAPAVRHVETAYQGLTAAQQKYQAAAAKEAADPTKSNKTALAGAALNLKLAHEQIAKLPASEQDAIKGISGLAREFGQMSRAFEPQAFKVFADGLRIVRNLLPSVLPFASTFASVLDGLLKKAGQFTQSKGFGDWLKQFHSLEGPALGAIGHGIGQVVTSVGKLMTTMSGKDVAHAINIAFGSVTGIITGITGAVQGLMSAWDGASARFKSNIHGIANEFDTIRHGFADTGHYWASVFDGARHGIASAWGSISNFFSSLPGKIKGFFSTAGSWLVSAGKAVVGGLIHGLESMGGSLLGAVMHLGETIISHKGPIEKDRVMLLPAGQAIVQGLITGLQGGQSAVNAAAKALGNTVAGPDSTITGAVAKLKAYIPGDTGLNKWLAGQGAKLQALAKQRAALEQEIADAQQVATSEIQNNSIMNAAGTAQNGAASPVATSDVITGMQQQAAAVKAFAQAIRQLKAEGLNATSLSQITGAGSASGLPVAQALLSGGKTAVAQINALQTQLKASASKLGDAAAAPMFQAGQQAAQGLAQGLKSQLGSVAAAMKQLADAMVREIKKDLKSHSPSLVMAEIGEGIPQGVAVGIGRAAHVAVGASAALATRTVQPWGRGGSGGGNGGGDVHFHINGLVVDPMATARQIQQLMRQYKRNGGNAPLGLA